MIPSDGSRDATRVSTPTFSPHRPGRSSGSGAAPRPIQSYSDLSSLSSLRVVVSTAKFSYFLLACMP